jgi:hypothetical protein
MANVERARLAGIACVLGAGLWLVVLLADVVAHDTVYASATSYRVWEGLLIVVQVLLFVGVVGLIWSGAAGTGSLGRIGLGIALLGRVAFLVGEIRSFVSGVDDELFIPIGAVLTTLGLLLAGIAILRARRWGGWHRLIPLLTGIYPLVAMFPIVAVTGDPSELMIALWGLFWVPLGIAIYVEAELATDQARTMAPAAA